MVFTGFRTYEEALAKVRWLAIHGKSKSEIRRQDDGTYTVVRVA
jgi:hypothetical protein